MNNTRIIDELSKHLSAIMPEGLRIVRQDFEKNLRTAVGSALGRLDLVTREEFDVQREVLLRTRAKLEQLERQIAMLEQGPERPARED